jgi:putative transcriptional regulator
MKKDGITKFRLDPNNLKKVDWTAFNAMTEEERHAAAISDPDCLPATEAMLATARRRVNVAALRTKLGLTQAEFASRFGLPIGTIRDWEQGVHIPDRAARVLLAVIAHSPDAVTKALELQRVG